MRPWIFGWKDNPLLPEGMIYIIKPAQGAKQGEVGTSGTPVTVYLKKHIQETKNHLL